MKQEDMNVLLYQAIDSARDDIIHFGEDIYKHPETGFREVRTSDKVAGFLRGLGLEVQTFADIPGVKVTLDTGRPGPGICLLGELDAIICSEHPDADATTGAIHACGHNVQLGALVGACIGLLKSGVYRHLCGKVHFIAVPAEEYIELEYRKTLKDQGRIKYLAGKPELLYRGWFDDVDLCVMMHVQSSSQKFILESTHNGLMAKKIRFIGKASHAGSEPHEGINALYAANLALNAINSLRETFRENEYIRVHPIITKGGEIVNVIPSDVQLETYIRGKNIDDMIRIAHKVDQALAGSAIAIGASVVIENTAGYLPIQMDEHLTEAAKCVLAGLVQPDEITERGHGTGSSDLGDLCSLMPVIESSVGGVSGMLHSAAYRMADADTAYLLGAKYLAGMAVVLMANDAAKAKRTVQKYKPMFNSKTEYFHYVDQFFVKKQLNGSISQLLFNS